MAAAVVDLAIARSVDAIRSTSDSGALHRELAQSAPHALLAAAVSAWRSCHRSAPVAQDDGRVAISNVPLIYFYRNRTKHISLCGNRIERTDGGAADDAI